MEEEDYEEEDWKTGHRRAAQSLDIIMEGVRLRDLDKTPTQEDPQTRVTLRKVGRERGKSF